MKILSDDGKEFNSVEECKQYEIEYNKNKIISESLNISSYLVTDIYDKIIEVIYVHTITARKTFAECFMLDTYGQPYCFTDNVPISQALTRKYKISSVQTKTQMALRDEYLKLNEAVYIELNDVPKVFNDKKRYFTINSTDGAMFKLDTK